MTGVLFNEHEKFMNCCILYGDKLYDKVMTELKVLAVEVYIFGRNWKKILEEYKTHRNSLKKYI
jgi:hypothetical protein